MSDNGNDNYDAAAEAERRRQERIRYLQAKRADLERKIRALEAYMEELEEIKENTNGDVNGPMTDYDLMVNLDIAHWNGDREKDGEEKRDESTGRVAGHNSDIDRVIDKIKELLKHYRDELKSVIDELHALGA